ncbi:protein of unknown function (plasmid) [Caballeronia sp. S22]
MANMSAAFTWKRNDALSISCARSTGRTARDISRSQYASTAPDDSAHIPEPYISDVRHYTRPAQGCHLGNIHY